MSTQHTALPLPLTFTVRDKDGSVYISGGDVDSRFTSFDVACGEEEAAFIVRACNNHEALVAAVQSLLPVVSEMVKERVYKTQRAKTEASLAKINKELADLYARTNQARAALATATQ